MKLTTIEKNVAYVLRNYPTARENDNCLVFFYWTLVDEATLDLQSISEATSAETITRCRRKLNELGEFIPSKLTRSRRKKWEEKIKTYALQRYIFVDNVAIPVK